MDYDKIFEEMAEVKEKILNSYTILGYCHPKYDMDVVMYHTEIIKQLQRRLDQLDKSVMIESKMKTFLVVDKIGE